MKNNNKWYIGDVNIINNIGSLRLSDIEILNSQGISICSIRTYSQPIARKIVDCVNEYDELKLKVEKLESKLKQCKIAVNTVLDSDKFYNSDCYYLANRISLELEEE